MYELPGSSHNDNDDTPNNDAFQHLNAQTTATSTPLNLRAQANAHPFTHTSRFCGAANNRTETSASPLHRHVHPVHPEPGATTHTNNSARQRIDRNASVRRHITPHASSYHSTLDQELFHQLEEREYRERCSHNTPHMHTHTTVRNHTTSTPLVGCNTTVTDTQCQIHHSDKVVR